MYDQLRPASLGGAKLERYFHACAFFSSRDEEYRVLEPFISEGLRWGEKAIHITAPELRDDHLQRLADAGIEIDAHQREGRLEVLTWLETYLLGGRFDPDAMLSTVESTVQRGLAQGCPRSRIIGHMEWAHEEYPGVDHLLEYEVRVNDALACARQPGVCVYDLNRLSGAMVIDLLRAHPLAIVDGTLHENPFYTQADEMLKELRSRGRVASPS